MTALEEHSDKGRGAGSSRPDTDDEALLAVRNLSMSFHVSRGFLGMGGRMTVNAVTDVDLTIRRGRRLVWWGSQAAARRRWGAASCERTSRHRALWRIGARTGTWSILPG